MQITIISGILFGIAIFLNNTPIAMFALTLAYLGI